MKRLSMLWLLTLLLSGLTTLTGCSSSDEDQTISGLTTLTGNSSSDEDQTFMYDYDELPAWLVPQAQKMVEEFKGIDIDPSLLFGIRRATGIHGETVYHIWRAYDSCWMCNLYDVNGNPIAYADAFGENDVIGNEGWVVIFPK